MTKEDKSNFMIIINTCVNRFIMRNKKLNADLKHSLKKKKKWKPRRN